MSDRQTPTVTPLLPKTLDDVSDAWLIQTCLQKNPSSSSKAFRELVKRYSRLVCHFVYQMTQNQQSAEEITQEVFLKVHQNLHRFDTSKPFKPWIMRIASNTSISLLRKEQKATVVSMDVLAEQGWQLNEAEHMENRENTTAETELEQYEEHLSNETLVKTALNRLDDKYRHVLMLRYTQEFSYEDISQSLGIPLNTVRTWLRRGLEQFKKAVVETQQAYQQQPSPAKGA